MPDLDTLLDRSIALGYTRIGLEARRRQSDWAKELPRMDGRTVLVTGAGTGIGRASAEEFARLGARVCMLVRDAGRYAAERDRIASASGGDVRLVSCDVSSLESVRMFAEKFAREEDRLDVIVNNAGVMPAERQVSADNVELTFATHVAGPFVLVHELLDMLRASAPARVINVVSGGMYAQRLPSDDLELQHGSYGPKKAYARSKRAEMVMTELLAERLADDGVVVHAMHPGWVDTPGVRRWMPVFRAVTAPVIRRPAEGADTIVWLGAAEEPLESTGQLWHDRRARPTHYRSATRETEADRAALWAHCERLAGVSSSSSR